MMMSILLFQKMQVIVYETPRFGSHHFSLDSCSSSEEVKITLKKPIWVEDLLAKTTLPDLVLFFLNCVLFAKFKTLMVLGIQDQVILAVNSAAAAAKLFCEKLDSPEISSTWSGIMCM